jgi:acyl carrier protein
MDDPLFLMRHRLRSAIVSGIVARTDSLDDCGTSLDEILDTDGSLDQVELIMALEEKSGAKIDTVDDLMRSLDAMMD